ncbi:MAG: molybdopterin adenylyltransferase [Thermodesulfobacteriota bacterium]|nr:molybdopterin adenylyltransferase [Thermodesulfobacteriota bacterium]
MTAAILILSDKGAAGQREDRSGPTLIEWLAQQQVETVRYQMIPDDFDTIVSTLTDWADEEFSPLIITCGGTGVSPRDVTPEATLQVVDRVLPGFGELMRAESLKITPMAILSRALAGIRGQCLIINLPGSPKAALENLQAVWPAIPHTIDKICGDTSDCTDRHHRYRG